MLLKHKYHCMYQVMKRHEMNVLEQFYKESEIHGVLAQQMVAGFVDLRKSRESEFSKDARSLMAKSISISGAFAQFVSEFIKSKDWLYEPTDSDIQKEYESLPITKKFALLYV